jgi:FtsP/CotA-like multicopper oxidase with cupredoxin domain
MAPDRPCTAGTRLLALVVILTVLASDSMAESRFIALSIRGGALPADQRLIRVRQGDEVTLQWTTDKKATIHVHGYDIETALTPDTPVTIRFSARATGRFPIEVHGTTRGPQVTLGYLEVHPR